MSSWTTEEDKREKIFKIGRVQEMIQETYKLYENQSVTAHYKKGYEERGSMCPPSMAMYGPSNRERKRCQVSELLADEYAVNNILSVPTDRMQTPEEALELSIWSPYTTFNMSILRFCINWNPGFYGCATLVRLSWMRPFVEILSLSAQHSLPG